MYITQIWYNSPCINVDAKSPGATFSTDVSRGNSSELYASPNLHHNLASQYHLQELCVATNPSPYTRVKASGIQCFMLTKQSSTCHAAPNVPFIELFTLTIIKQKHTASVLFSNSKTRIIAIRGVKVSFPYSAHHNILLCGREGPEL